MKVLLAPTLNYIAQSSKETGLEILNYPFDVHPSRLKEAMEHFIDTIDDFDPGPITTNNIQALNYIPVEYISWIDQIETEDGETKLVITPFSEAFEDFLGGVKDYIEGFVAPGYIYMQACTEELPRDSEALKEGKIKFIVPEGDWD